MAEEFSLVGFARFFVALHAEIEHAKHSALEKSAKIIEEEAKRVLGTYEYGWDQLAEATQEDRLSHGFSENEPGLRTGEMKESISHQVSFGFGGLESEAEIGSNDINMLWFEQGTITQPPRPTLEGAAVRKAEEIARRYGVKVIRTIENGRFLDTDELLQLPVDKDF